MKFQLSYFKSWKMMLWKCCTQYASKFGKLSSGHRTEKGEFSFQSQRKAMPKNVQTTAQLYSSHTLVKLCSRFSKPGLNSMWTMNFQMFELDLEKAEEPEIKLPTSAGLSKKSRELQKIICFCFIEYAKAFDCVDHNKLWKILKKMGNQTTLLAAWETCMRVKKQQLEMDMHQKTGSNWKRNVSKTCILTLLI